MLNHSLEVLSQSGILLLLPVKDFFLAFVIGSVLSIFMFEVFGKELYLSFFQDELSNILNLQMKTAIRKMVTYNKVIFFKKLLISVVFMVFFVLLLYVLINSPA